MSDQNKWLEELDRQLEEVIPRADEDTGDFDFDFSNGVRPDGQEAYPGQLQGKDWLTL